ncbi:MAG: hypothetical protein JNL57_02245 [Bacteroidetes bacterium]|nr:hypothetical protein [Bacteroidota bacterium]
MEDPKKETADEADFYLEHGFRVWTESYLRKRGFCCGSGCRHCPYSPRHVKGNTAIANNVNVVNKL